MDDVKNIVFDLGGVIMTIDQNQAVSRFKEIGLTEAESYLDPYTQTGVFGELEEGLITAEDFRRELSEIIGKDLSFDECEYAWRGYCKELPQRNLDALVKLKQEGYRLILLSNTNPFMMHWALSDQFDRNGHSLNDYFDALYLSYQNRMMKPNEHFFRKMMMSEKILPQETLFVDDGPRNVAAASELGIHTFCPVNGADWTEDIYHYLR
jgi:putative hydrolase of the HAD superfamily